MRESSLDSMSMTPSPPFKGVSMMVFLLTSSVVSFQMKLNMAFLSSLIMSEGKIIQEPTYQSLEQIDVLTSIALAESVRFRPRYRLTVFFTLSRMAFPFSCVEFSPIYTPYILIQFDHWKPNGESPLFLHGPNHSPLHFFSFIFAPDAFP